MSYKNNKKAGKATAIVEFKGGYSGTVKKTFTIRPAGTSIKKLTAASGGFTVKWKKKTAQTSGYQIQYSTSAGFKGNSTRSFFVKKASVTKQTVKNLKADKKYYVRIRTYKTVNADGKNTKVYSAWSGSVRVRTLPASGGEKTAYSARNRDFIAVEREDRRKRGHKKAHGVAPGPCLHDRLPGFPAAHLKTEKESDTYILAGELRFTVNVDYGTPAFFMCFCNAVFLLSCQIICRIQPSDVLETLDRLPSGLGHRSAYPAKGWN